MKFRCTCSYVFSDVADQLPFKAYGIPDQHMDRLHDLVDTAVKLDSEAPQEVTEPVFLEILTEFRGSLTMFQCPECGGLHLFPHSDPEEVYSFSPLGEVPKRLLEKQY